MRYLQNARGSQLMELLSSPGNSAKMCLLIWAFFNCAYLGWENQCLLHQCMDINLLNAFTILINRYHEVYLGENRRNCFDFFISFLCQLSCSVLWDSLEESSLCWYHSEHCTGLLRWWHHANWRWWAESRRYSRYLSKTHACQRMRASSHEIWEPALLAKLLGI